MQHACRNHWCKQLFELTEEDRRYYEGISPVFCGRKELIPPPDLCPDCRTQRRIIWRPELHLHYRKSDLSGDTILSMYPSEAPCKVYSVDEWWSDDWDPKAFGCAFDFGRPFFAQFKDLFSVVPLVAVSVSKSGNVNSDFVNSASFLKNCYLLSGANYNEDCLYGNFVNHCRDCLDCSFIDHCELCYECIDCTKCYGLRYAQQCSNCSDSQFLFSCRNCKYCFGCVNLTDKSYMFLNEQLTQKAYEKRLADLALHRRGRVREARAFFERHRLQYPHKFMIGEMNENVTGNGVLRSRNVRHSFDVSELEDCDNCVWFHKAKNCRDCYAWGFTAEECNECLEVGDQSHRTHFSILIYHGVNLLYCNNCRNCEDCFGCVSLRHSRHCIFNRQYSKEDYEELVPRIIAHMRTTGEWGQFFPFSVCPLAYNQTIAQDYFPLDAVRAKALGARWAEEQAVSTQPMSPPDSLHDVTDDILQQTLVCSASGKPYKLTVQELAFYKEQEIPVPDECFFSRHGRRFARRNPRHLWQRTCQKCGKEMETSYSPDRPEIVYCEECYLKEVY